MKMCDASPIISPEIFMVTLAEKELMELVVVMLSRIKGIPQCDIWKMQWTRCRVSVLAGYQIR